MLLHLLINTLIVGSGYALVAMAFRLMNSVSPFFNMTIGAVAVLGGYTAYWLLGLGFPFWLDKKIFPERLKEVLQHFPDLEERLDGLAGNLSGGQQQMVALARGLLNRPKMVFMDEPSIGLAPKLINDTFRKLKEIKDNMGTSFVIVEHNLKTLLPLTDWAYILEQGRVIYDGPSEGKTLDKMLSATFK